MTFIKEYRLTIFSIFIAVALGVFIRYRIHQRTDNIVDMDLRKDSVINVITRDNRHLQITISEKDSVISVYYYNDKLQNRQIYNSLKKENELRLKLQLRDQTIDSLNSYINSFERVVVPN